MMTPGLKTERLLLWEVRADDAEAVFNCWMRDENVSRYKLMISMLTKGLASQKQRSAQADRMLELLSRDESYVSSENIAAVLQWYREEQL